MNLTSGCPSPRSSAYFLNGITRDDISFIDGIMGGLAWRQFLGLLLANIK